MLKVVPATDRGHRLFGTGESEKGRKNGGESVSSSLEEGDFKSGEETGHCQSIKAAIGTDDTHIFSLFSEYANNSSPPT